MNTDFSSLVPAYSGEPELHTMVFNSLHEMIAVINDSGAIVDVNPSWIQFGLDNGQSSDYA